MRGLYRNACERETNPEGEFNSPVQRFPLIYCACMIVLFSLSPENKWYGTKLHTDKWYRSTSDFPNLPKLTLSRDPWYYTMYPFTYGTISVPTNLMLPSLSSGA